MFFEGIEIPVVVKQGKASHDAECCDPTADGFMDGETLGTESPIVHSALQGKVPANHRVERKIRKVPFDGPEVFFFDDALQDLRENEVTDSCIAAPHNRFERAGLRRPDISEEIDPNSRINDDGHERGPCGVHSNRPANEFFLAASESFPAFLNVSMSAGLRRLRLFLSAETSIGALPQSVSLQ